MVFPDEQVDKFVFKEEVTTSYPNTFIVTKKNIISKTKHYNRIHSRFTELIYVKTAGRGYLKGSRSWSNRRGPLGLAYEIINQFKTLEETQQNIQEQENLNLDGYYKWVVWKNKTGRHILYEMFDKNNIMPAQSSNGEAGIFVKGKGEDILVIRDLDIKHTNNLGIEFHIQSEELYCLIRWIQHQGKVYKCVLFHTDNGFGVRKGRYLYGLNYITKGDLFEKDLNIHGRSASRHQMKMKRLWLVEDQAGGMSVNQYKRTRKQKNLGVDNTSIGLFLDEVLRDVKMEEVLRLDSV